MLCPQCDNSVLVHSMLAENLAAYACGKCLGTLVSLVSYRAWRESPLRQPITMTATAEAVAHDSTGAKKCPKCSSLMSKYRISSGKSNRLDYCPHCEDIWLDQGEWELVEGLVNSGEFTKIFTQAWQHDVRETLREGMQEQRLRDVLGADYERVMAFAAWLEAHPARQEILAALQRRKR